MWCNSIAMAIIVILIDFQNSVESTFFSCRPILGKLLEIPPKPFAVKEVHFSPLYFTDKQQRLQIFNVSLVRMTQKKNPWVLSCFYSVSLPGKILYNKLTNHSVNTNDLVQGGMGLIGGGEWANCACHPALVTVSVPTSTSCTFLEELTLCFILIKIKLNVQI